MRIADYSVTRAVLERHGFTFKKSFGQNFLTDTNILQKIVDTAEIDKNVNVIEIGPGIGALTEFLAENAAEVYITTPILMHLIESKIPFAEFVVMMQKEVADRISAEPNTKAYGSLSIAVQYYMTAKVAFVVPRTVFVPAPNVDSAILKMTRREQPLVQVKDEDFFFRVSKISFVHRRKTLWNNLTSHFGKADEIKAKLEQALEIAEIKPSIRGEALSIAEFAKLADALKEVGL